MGVMDILRGRALPQPIAVPPYEFALASGATPSTMVRCGSTSDRVADPKKPRNPEIRPVCVTNPNSAATLKSSASLSCASLRSRPFTGVEHRPLFLVHAGDGELVFDVQV
jgi:hypothetical protein